MALPDLTTLDSEELKALVIQQHAIIVENQALVLEKNATLESQQDEIERLKLFIAKLQRMQFGTSSERLARHIDQLELGLEDLETNRVSQPTLPVSESVTRKPARKPLGAWLPREVDRKSV